MAKATAVQTARSWIERLWVRIAERGGAVAIGGGASPLDRVRVLAETLVSERGEASGAVVARELQAALLKLSDEERLQFFEYVAAGFTPDEAKLREAAEAYLAESGPLQAQRLAEAAEPPRQELLRRMNMSPSGTATLVEMRRQLLTKLRETPQLAPLDADLHHLLSSWFNRGFLELRRIDWQTPAVVLEKLIEYEAVHEIQGWDDLRRRLAADRRCFGFFHPALPDEPLIFVEVALVEGLAGAVQPLLARDGEGKAAEAAARARAAKADTAIFYSISNCQDGLRGVSFGNFLIKQVVEELKAELPHLKVFSTLSPVPGFRRWLEKRLADAAEPVMTEEERIALGGDQTLSDSEMLLAVLGSKDAWWEVPETAQALGLPITRLAAEFLTHADGPKGVRDPVARFHLGNGARLERINWLGNISPRGMREAYGIMVNYLYDLGSIEANHEAFVRDGTVARGTEVKALLAPPHRTPPKRRAG